MNRRDSMRALIWSGSAMVVSWPWMSCDSATSSSGFFSAAEDEVITALVEMILPAGKNQDEPGALDLAVDELLKKLLEKCYPADTQALVKSHLAQLNLEAQQKFKQGWAKCSLADRTSIFINWQDQGNEEQKKFCELMKSQTIMGYRTSEKIMVEVYNYEVAPGRYIGCMAVND